MSQIMCFTPRLPPLNGKPILLGFDGAHMGSDAGLALLREIERKADLAQPLAGCLRDPRDPANVQHSLGHIQIDLAEQRPARLIHTTHYHPCRFRAGSETCSRNRVETGPFQMEWLPPSPDGIAMCQSRGAQRHAKRRTAR